MIRPIDIQIKDVYKYGLLALLFDRPDFIKDVFLIRKRLGLQKPISYEAVDGYLKELENKARKSKNTLDDLVIIQEDGLSEITVFTDAEFVRDIDFLKKKYKKNKCYEMAIAYAILSGVVKETEFTTTVWVQYLDEQVLKYLKMDEHFQVSLVILPETRIEDIRKMLNKGVRHFLKSIEFPKPDLFPNIKYSRKLYWLRQSMSWSELFQYIRKRSRRKIVNQTIRSAVRNYEKQLRIPLYSSIPSGNLKTV